MVESAKSNFVKILTATLAIYDKTATADVIGLWWNLLQPYDMQAIEKAFSDYLRSPDSKFSPPKPGGIIEMIDNANPDGRVSANEAWAMMPRSEQDSVVWSEEMSAAMAIAQPLLDEGDQVGARMAFIGAYDRLVSDARRNGIKPHWIASLGWDVDKRRECIEQAQRVGRINSSYAAGLLPAPRDTGPVMAAIMGQPTLRIASFDGNVVQMMTEEETAKKAIANLRDMLKKGAL